MLLESPRDPAEYLSDQEGAQSASFWCFPEITAWVGTAGLRLVTFDQGRLGHQRKKPTTVLTNLPAFEELHGLQGEGCDDGPLPTKLADRIRTSKSWAAWAPGLVVAIKESLRRLLGVLEEEGW